MAREKSPFPGKISLNKLAEVGEYLAPYHRYVWISPRKGSRVMLRWDNEGTVWGPMPNWKAYKMMCEILAWCQSDEKQREESARTAEELAASGKLFITAY